MTVFAHLRNEDEGTLLTCEFNPSTVKLAKSTTWSTPRARNAKDHPRPQFVGTGPQTLTLNLLFNAYDRDGSTATTPVATAISQLFDWTCPTSRSQEANSPLPPTISFFWSAQVTVTGFIKQVEVEYLLFDTDGSPLRATATVVLQTLPANVPGTNPTSGGITGRRSTQMTDADTLAGIAQREYGDAALWRAIAIANDLDDPARVPPGTRLLLPPRTQAVPLSAVGGDPR
ncbi:MAG: LysM peptidoglycan-binding domain-containing protein [Actinocrinis sp.]